MNETRIDEPLFLHFVLRNACDTNRLANCLSGSAAKREIKETKNGGKKKEREGQSAFCCVDKANVEITQLCDPVVV